MRLRKRARFSTSEGGILAMDAGALPAVDRLRSSRGTARPPLHGALRGRVDGDRKASRVRRPCQNGKRALAEDERHLTVEAGDKWLPPFTRSRPLWASE